MVGFGPTVSEIASELEVEIGESLTKDCSQSDVNLAIEKVVNKNWNREELQNSVANKLSPSKTVSRYIDFIFSIHKCYSSVTKKTSAKFLCLTQKYKETDCFDKAFSFAKQGVVLYPSDIALLKAHAELAEIVGQWHAAISSLKTLIKLYEKKPPAKFYVRLCKLLIKVGAFDEAYKYTSAGLILYPDNSRLSLYFNHMNIFSTSECQFAKEKFIDPVFSFMLQNKDKTAYEFLSQSYRSIVSVYENGQNGLSNLIANRGSDTLFILGSGPSINSISSEQWAYISEHDSWGFNFWFAHPFIPSAYFAQIPKADFNRHVMYQIMVRRLIDYKEYNVPFYFRGAVVRKGNFQNDTAYQFIKNHFDLKFLAEYVVHPYSTIKPTQLVDKMFKCGFFSPNNNIACPKFGSTIGFLVSLAIVVGYKNVVLCGIDMNNSFHFYDNYKYWSQFPSLLDLYKFNSDLPVIHPHVNLKTLSYTVPDYLYALKFLFLRFFGGRLFVSSDTSVLYPTIQKYFFSSDDSTATIL